MIRAMVASRSFRSAHAKREFEQDLSSLRIVKRILPLARILKLLPSFALCTCPKGQVGNLRVPVVVACIVWF
jgi:hypothetical protein